MEQDEILIKKAAAGDIEAFRKIIDTYKHYVFAIIFNITKNKEETENISQETFIKVYNSLNSYEGKGFKSWIGKVAVHNAIDWKRKEVKDETGIKEYYQHQEIFNNMVTPSPEEKILKGEEAERLRALLDQLPEKYCTILQKYYLHSMSYKEIAELEGISIRTVESRLYRGKNLLREAWKEETDDATLLQR